MKKSLSRKVSIFAALTLGLGMAFSGALSPSTAKTSFDFEACVESKKSASVLLMMDESGSIYGDGGREPSDPEHMRITGAEVLFNSLQKVSSVYQTKIRVKLAGFGDNFKVRSGGDDGWIEITPNQPTQGLNQLVNHARQWVEKPKDKNYRETDLLSALAGAQGSLESEPKDACKLFVFFKDGADFQEFTSSNQNHSLIPGYQSIHEELAKETGKSLVAATKMAVSEICRKGGLADALRRIPQTYTLGVAINPGGDKKGLASFRAVVEGTPSAECQGGEEPAQGEILDATSVNDLPFLFQKALSPNWKPNTARGNFNFEVADAISGVTILSSGIPSAFNSFKLIPPSSCSGAKPAQVLKGNSSAIPTSYEGVDIRVNWLGVDGQNRTLTIDLKRNAETTSSCWSGTWFVEPGTDTSSTYSFEVDLQAVADFGSEELVLQGGEGTSSKTYKVALEQRSTGMKKSVSEVMAGAQLEVTGELRTADTKEHVDSDWDQRVLRNDEIDSDLEFSAVELENGQYELVLNLQVFLPSFSGELKPMTSQRQITVRSAFEAPLATNQQQVIDFGLISGNQTVKTAVFLNGSPAADFKLKSDDLKEAVRLFQFPEGVSYELQLASGPGTEVTIKKGVAGQSVELSITAVSTTKDASVRANGLIRGELVLPALAVTANETKSPTDIVMAFKAEQKASVDSSAQALYLAVFFILGVLLTLGSVILVTWIVGRFPSQKFLNKNGMLPRASRVDLSFGSAGIAYSAAIEGAFTKDQNFNLVDISKNRRVAFVAGEEFRVKTHGLSLKEVGHGQIQNNSLIGFSSTDRTSPTIPLSLATTWLLLTTEDQLRLAKSGGQASATLIVLASVPDDPRVSELARECEAEVQSVLSDLLEKTQITDQDGSEHETSAEKSSAWKKVLKTLLPKKTANPTQDVSKIEHEDTW